MPIAEWSESLGPVLAHYGVALRGEPSPLIVGQTKTSAAEVFLQNSILLNQELDYAGLVSVDPASPGSQEQLNLNGGRRNAAF